MYAMSGVLQPPNWPHVSNDRILCQWSIILPNPEMNVSLLVDEIDIAEGRTSTCFWNYLLVWDSMAVDSGIPPWLIPRMCGRTPPDAPVTAAGHIVNVWYHTQFPPNRGFLLSFSAV